MRQQGPEGVQGGDGKIFDVGRDQNVVVEKIDEGQLLASLPALPFLLERAVLRLGTIEREGERRSKKREREKKEEPPLSFFLSFFPFRSPLNPPFPLHRSL